MLNYNTIDPYNVSIGTTDLKLAGDVVLLRFNGCQLVSQMYKVEGSVYQLVCPLGDREVMEVASRVVIEWVVVCVHRGQF